MKSPEEIEQANLVSISQMTDSELQAWMLDGCKLTPVWYNEDRENWEHAYNLWQISDNDFQIRFNNAIFIALSSWNQELHMAEAVSNLAQLALYTKNTDVVPVLTKIIDQQIISEPIDPDNHFRSIVISVIAGFIPDPQAEETVIKWWNDESFDWHSKPMLFRRLLQYRQDMSEQLVSGLLKIFENHPPDRLFLEIIAKDAMSILGKEQLITYLRGEKSKTANHILSLVSVK